MRRFLLAGACAILVWVPPLDADTVTHQRVAVPSSRPSLVTVGWLARWSGVEPVSEEAAGVVYARIHFLDAQDREVPHSGRDRQWSGTSEWAPYTEMVRVPSEASSIEFSFGLNGAKGSAAFDQLWLKWNAPDDEDLENLVVDGGFEAFGPLSPWEVGKAHRVVYPGLNGRGALLIQSDRPDYSQTSQLWSLEGAAPAQRIRCSLTLSVQDLTVVREGGGFRVEVEFLDEHRRSLARETALKFQAPTKGPAEFSGEVSVARGTRYGRVRLAMEGATGRVLVDDVRLQGIGSAGAVSSVRRSRTDLSAWGPFDPPDGEWTGPLDASSLLDPPAGRHGFLMVREGRFLFEDGTPARFFGVNIQAEHALPTHEQAERMARRLAQMGCNLVRLHHLDAGWAERNLFDPRADNTQRLSADSLDRLDYFIARLKARGIYVYLDLLVNRKFRKADRVASYRQLSYGAKVAAEYDPRLIELQQSYAKALWTHKNRYTGLRLADDPALALTEIVNESSLFRAAKERGRLPDFYLRELEQLWIRYCARQGIPANFGGTERFLNAEDPEVRAFTAQLQAGYFQQMHAALRRIGLKIPIAGSNWDMEGGDLATNAEMDFVDRHDYWDHPRGGFGDLVRFHNRSMLDGFDPENLVSALSGFAVEGKPFVVSEWNIPWPNEYRAAGPILMAAAALFQGWDGLIFFNYDGEFAPSRMRDNFDLSTKPELFLQFPVAARLFHRADVAPARVKRLWPVFAEQEVPPETAWLHAVRRVSSAGNPERPSEAGPPWVSDTGELVWDPSGGFVLIRSGRTEAAIGRLNGGKVRLPHMELQVESPFACVALCSLDGLPLGTSGHLLLMTVARSENTGTVYNGTRTFLLDAGSDPIQMERVVGSAIVPVGRRAAVFALDAAGRRVNQILGKARDGALEIPLGQAFLYELIFEEG